MENYEKLGAFYLGRSYDLKNQKRREGLLLYDSKDLVTHAVCVGMTGSGKTGLGLTLLEEAAIDGIPALIIDPKGDLSNLLLTFPQLRGEDLEPWINVDDARRKRLSSPDYARQQADLWKKGLAEWGQNGERIQRLKNAADFVIYTPGSSAGVPISVLKSFAAPGPSIVEDRELLRERIGTTATSLLGLLGVQADPIQSRDHILLSTLFNHAWLQGRDFDMPALIQQIQTPPLDRVGVMDLESFYPAKERFQLAMQLNNMLAAPGFEAWMEGEALNVDAFLHTPEGKPRLSIFSIAHLSDSERMFFVSLLLNQVLGWMRTQSGTTSLRALVYMDEIFGYFPPVANPPSKAPLLTLLKQARAFGVGIVLATQNPVDLDYKGLSNTGTWFVGRLQTDRDKARVLDGLEGAAATAATSYDRRAMEQTLAGLGQRIFLMNNVHENAPEVFETRWALCYLRGPLTRDQIRVLMSDRKASSSLQSAAAATATQAAGTEAKGTSAASATTTPLPSKVSPAIESSSVVPGSARPVLPPEISQFFLPLRSSQPAGSQLFYRPMVLGCAKVYFSDAKAGVDAERSVAVLSPISSTALTIDWQEAQAVEVGESDLEKEPSGGALYAPLPALAAKVKSFEGWKRSFIDSLYRNQVLNLLRSPTTRQVSGPEESEGKFRIRLQQAAREERDRQVEKLRQKYAPKLAQLQDRIRRAQQAVERETEQAQQQKLQTAISFGTTLLGAFLGRKALSAASLGRATTAARGVGRAMKESQDVARVGETVEALQQQLTHLESQLQAEIAALEVSTDPLTEKFETVTLKPKKTNIAISLLSLVWVPFWQQANGSLSSAWE
jgi:hypothetical protein